MMHTEFGYYPFPFDVQTGPIQIETLPDLNKNVSDVSAFETIDNNWLFLPPHSVRFATGAGSRIFSLPKTHRFTHHKALSNDHLEYHVWALSFLVGMRLTTSEAGFVDATPIKPHTLVDFAIGSDIRKAIDLAEEFWKSTRHLPAVTKGFGAAVHALFLAQNPQLFQYEEFILLYTALDACFGITRKIRSTTTRITHADRIGWMCGEFGMASPLWATRIAGTEPELAAIRNPVFHEALFIGEPLGFALHGVRAGQNLSLEMTALVCRLLVAILGGKQTEYVRSPINTRSLHALNL